MYEIECPKCKREFIHDEEEEIMCPYCDHEFLLNAEE